MNLEEQVENYLDEYWLCHDGYDTKDLDAVRITARHFIKLLNERLIEFQQCPNCNGQGQISKPVHINGDVNEWTSSQVSYMCPVCNGAKIIQKGKSNFI